MCVGVCDCVCLFASVFVFAVCVCLRVSVCPDQRERWQQGHDLANATDASVFSQRYHGDPCPVDRMSMPGI